MRWSLKWVGVALAVLTLLPPRLAAQRGAFSQETNPLTLEEAVSLALGSHPVVGRARAHRTGAEARLEQARASWLPSLTTEGSLARFQEPMVVAPLHGFDPTRPPSFDRNLVQGNLSLGYTIFDGGARGARVDRAEAGVAAAAVGEELSRMDLTLQVSRAYLAVLAGEELVEAAEAQIQALESEEDRARQFLEEGKAARVDRLRVQAALSRARADAISVRSDLDLAWGRLARLTGATHQELRERALLPVKLGDDPTPSRGRTLETARSNSPDLALARRELAAAAAEVREAGSTWLPSLQAAGRYQNYGTLDGKHTQEWQATLSVAYPIFTGGARGAEEQGARAEEREAAQGLRLAELEVEEKVEDGLAALAEARARREALELGVTQSREVARIEALALEAGAGVQTDFLKAQADLFRARAALVQARHGEILARLQLARVMGELTQEWIEEHVEVKR